MVAFSIGFGIFTPNLGENDLQIDDHHMFQMGLVQPSLTPRKINIEPENDGLESMIFLFQGCILRFQLFIFRCDRLSQTSVWVFGWKPPNPWAGGCFLGTRYLRAAPATSAGAGGEDVEESWRSCAHDVFHDLL